MELYGGDSARQYADFGNDWVGAESPVFRDWALAIAEDAEVLALVDTLPELKRQPNLVLAAGRWHGAEPGPYDGLRRVLLDQWPAVRETVLTRATQTNEVARCATLLPVLAGLPGPLALIEVGASAGLCLHPDRYSYRWSDGSALDPAGGPSRVVLTCEVSGNPPLPVAMPEVVWRAGIDLNPLDVGDDDAMAWLENLVWPGQDERRARLRAAIDVAREDPPVLVQGDLVDTLPALVDQAPPEATLVVFHSAVIFYLPPGRRADFARMMGKLVGARRVHWISNEGPEVVPGISLSAPPDGCFALALDGVPVALTHGHGRSLHWLGAGEPSSDATRSR